MMGDVKPVAWRVKDFADGWIIYQSEDVAKAAANGMNSQLEPLYVRTAKSVYSRRELEQNMAVAMEALIAYDKLERNGVSAHDKWNAVTRLVRTAIEKVKK